jgi:hypothetical protein
MEIAPVGENPNEIIETIYKGRYLLYNEIFGKQIRTDNANSMIHHAYSFRYRERCKKRHKTQWALIPPPINYRPETDQYEKMAPPDRKSSEQAHTNPRSFQVT